MVHCNWQMAARVSDPPVHKQALMQSNHPFETLSSSLRVDASSFAYLHQRADSCHLAVASIQVVGPFSSPPSHTRAAIYHFGVKSKREFLQKMKRAAGDGTRKNKAFFTSINAAATATCVAGMRLGLACCSGALNKHLGTEGVAGVQAPLRGLDRVPLTKLGGRRCHQLNKRACAHCGLCPFLYSWSCS